MANRQKEPTHSHNAEEMERCLLHGLSLEYDHALLMLDTKTALTIKKPLFRLSNAQHQLGSWHAAKREISISRNFAFFHSWGAIREVLLHEMAHQITDEVLNGSGEPAHGPTFHKACRWLRANPKASGSYPRSDPNDPPHLSLQQNRLLGRVKKLMALSRSQNTHEAAAAMAKAHQLIVNYNLPLLENGQCSEYTTTFLGNPALRHYREDYHIVHLLQEFYFVDGLWVLSYVVSKGKMGRVLEISGTSTNVEIASYVYDCVRNYIEHQWKIFSQGTRLGRYRKSDFATGIIAGFHQKLGYERYRHPLKTNERALILKGDPHLKVYMSDRYPHTRTVRSSSAAMHLDIYNHGVTQGKRLSLFKGVKGDRLSTDRLLEK